MTDQLISLKTAKLAKGKGFTQNPFKVKDAYGPKYTNGSNIKLRVSSLFNPDSNTCTAPTQTRLQKWLREEHNIAVTAVRIQWKKTYKYHWEYLDNKNWWKESKRGWCTYEKALEQGLIEALKLI